MAKRKTKKSNAAATGGERARALRRFALRWGLRLAVAALLVAALALGAVRAAEAVAAHPGFGLQGTAIFLSEDNKVVRGDAMSQELHREVGHVLAEDANVFEHDLCARVEHELRASPWVLDVRHVRRVLPNRLSIDLAFRKPAALVAHGTEAYMIDTDGYWLPDGERDGLFHRPKRWQGANAPVLVNHRLNHHPPRGRPWGGPAQAVGARLYTFLEAKGLFTVLPVVEIDVTNVGRTTGPGVEPEILLTTRDGVEVKWGRCDAYADVPGLTHLSPFYSDERKLQMLSAKIREYPSLEGLQYIDLRFNKFFFRTAPQPPTDAEPAP